jgi:hypothetical protein
MCFALAGEKLTVCASIPEASQISIKLFLFFCLLACISYLWGECIQTIVTNPDPHQYGKSDPDPHQSKKQGPYQHQSQLLQAVGLKIDLQIANDAEESVSKQMLRIRIRMDPHQFGKPDPDPH